MVELLLALCYGQQVDQQVKQQEHGDSMDRSGGDFGPAPSTSLEMGTQGLLETA